MVTGRRKAKDLLGSLAPDGSDCWKVAFGGDAIAAALDRLFDHFGREDLPVDELNIAADHIGRVEITLPMKPPNFTRPSLN